ncbi:FAD-binding oxidoreductase [bacterium]|nr:FAD-binding oxidoreductase [bacterium]
MLNGQYRELFDRLHKTIPKARMFHDDLSLLAFGTDAGFYRLLPKLVIRAGSEDEVQLILRACTDLKLPVTFRSAGTSLSGQSISDSVLVMLDQGWKDMEILENGRKIRVQTGVVGADANKKLLPLGRKIGPDPASINSAMIGGIVGNNAGGMGCGTVEDSYGTIAGMRIVFPDGTLLDTLDEASVKAFRASHQTLTGGIAKLRDSVLGNRALADRIRHKYRIKNTTGYTLKALVDFEDPVDIIQHLLVGSEGTLAFTSEVTFHTVHEFVNKATALVIFPDTETACRAVALLKETCVDSVELMDRAALRSVEDKPGMPEVLKTLQHAATALLIETRHDDADTLASQVQSVKDALKSLPVVAAPEFTRDPAAQDGMWAVRKGLFPSVSANRKAGTTVIIEDVAFDVPRLADAVHELQSLFRKHGYTDAILFGHALEGNLHFVIKQDFNDPEEVERYRAFIGDLTNMVVGTFDGSLKAEHGTGRNMAPFVRLEWGDEAYAVMQEIKRLFDPENILNPGVLLNDDAEIYLKNLKPLPPAHPLVDACIECGFCEVHCVSNTLTLSPRQRIAVYREIRRLIRSGEEPHRLAQLRDGFRYRGEETCATDGLCAQGCPVDIETGALVKELRHTDASPGARKLAGLLASGMNGVTAMARFGLNVVHGFHLLLGSAVFASLTRGVRILSGNRIPLWNPAMPGGGKKIKTRMSADSGRPKVVYFPSCITRAMGPSRDYREAVQLTELTVRLLDKAGYDVVYPENLDNLCCGMAFASKGFREAGDAKALELGDALLEAAQNGGLPVLCDMSPCLYRMKETLDPRLSLYEPIEFTLKFLADRLVFSKKRRSIAIHPVCSAKKMGLEKQFLTLAGMCAEKVVVPENNCCGFAGDRGFTHPELNAHGLRNLKKQIPEDCEAGFSTSRTCEIGLTLHSGISYKSVLYLVDECTVAR